MAELCQLYRINEENLNLRKQFIRLTADDVAILRQLQPWAEERASQIAKAFYDHQFTFSETRAFFEKFAQQRGLTLEQLRNHFEKAQAGWRWNRYAVALRKHRLATSSISFAKLQKAVITAPITLSGACASGVSMMRSTCPRSGTWAATRSIWI